MKNDHDYRQAMKIHHLMGTILLFTVFCNPDGQILYLEPH